MFSFLDKFKQKQLKVVLQIGFCKQLLFFLKNMYFFHLPLSWLQVLFWSKIQDIFPLDAVFQQGFEGSRPLTN